MVSNNTRHDIDTRRTAHQSLPPVADALYGPITIICRNGRIDKKIPWSAFILTDSDWEWVKDARDILKVRSLALDRTIKQIAKLY